VKLESWLNYIQSLHPTEIELGLERVAEVAKRLGIDKPKSQVITVAGTNGKGSSVALLEAILIAHGISVGSFTSPHLHRYNERIKINGEEVADEEICQAFERIQTMRQKTPLTYFEFGALAALWVFAQSSPDVIVLEVGLGGRLDAVNIIDADVALITSISIDHTQWLGSNTELIGREKAGIIRAGKPVVCSELDPPLSLLQYADDLDAPVLRYGRDFCFEIQAQEQNPRTDKLHWWGADLEGKRLSFTGLPQPLLSEKHAASAIQALQLIDINLNQEKLSEALLRAKLPGRFELLKDQKTGHDVLFDVAHNPAAGANLATNLEALKKRRKGGGKIIAVLAMMADKDTNGFYQALESVVDFWYITQFDDQRSMPAEQLRFKLNSIHGSKNIQIIDNIELAYRQACDLNNPDDLILVTGSFFTVAAVRGMILGLIDKLE
jgi:dihydrofolate synthase/folylpolyglutamate synthase